MGVSLQVRRGLPHLLTSSLSTSVYDIIEPAHGLRTPGRQSARPFPLSLAFGALFLQSTLWPRRCSEVPGWRCLRARRSAGSPPPSLASCRRRRGDPLQRDSSFCSLSWPYTGPHFCTVLCGHARLVHARPYLGFSSAPSPGLLFCTGLCGRARLVLARPYLLKRLALITSIPYRRAGWSYRSSRRG